MTNKPFHPRNMRPTNPATPQVAEQLRDLPTDRLAELDERMGKKSEPHTPVGESCPPHLKHRMSDVFKRTSRAYRSDDDHA